MNDEIHSPEMVVLLGAILAAQWFSSTADGFLEACGNAVVWPCLLYTSGCGSGSEEHRPLLLPYEIRKTKVKQ